jgi:hypothetical protein
MLGLKTATAQTGKITMGGKVLPQKFLILFHFETGFELATSG